jgi:hypothetical protein
MKYDGSVMLRRISLCVGASPLAEIQYCSLRSMNKFVISEWWVAQQLHWANLTTLLDIRRICQNCQLKKKEGAERSINKKNREKNILGVVLGLMWALLRICFRNIAITDEKWPSSVEFCQKKFCSQRLPTFQNALKI